MNWLVFDQAFREAVATESNWYGIANNIARMIRWNPENERQQDLFVEFVKRSYYNRRQHTELPKPCFVRPRNKFAQLF